MSPLTLCPPCLSGQLLSFARLQCRALHPARRNSVISSAPFLNTPSLVNRALHPARRNSVICSFANLSALRACPPQLWRRRVSALSFSSLLLKTPSLKCRALHPARSYLRSCGLSTVGCELFSTTSSLMCRALHPARRNSVIPSFANLSALRACPPQLWRRRVSALDSSSLFSSPSLATCHSPLATFPRFSPLTPLFPLDTRIPPVSPLFPLDTKKVGGTPPSTGMTNRSFSAISFGLPLSGELKLLNSSTLELPIPCFLCGLCVLCGDPSALLFRGSEF